MSIYSSQLILPVHHYCGMFSNPRRVSFSNMGTLRCTQQAHMKIFQKFKICSKSQYFALWAKKCATCVRIKKFLVSHPYIPNVFQNQFWLAANNFRPGCDASKFKNAQKTTSNKIIIYDPATKVTLCLLRFCGELLRSLVHISTS